MRRLMVGLVMAAIVGMSVTGLSANDQEISTVDQEIAQKIVEGLQVKQQRGDLKGFNIGVRVDHGDVWMEGEVTDPAQRLLVLDTARRVHGVNQVVNGIRIAGEEPPVAREQPPVQPAVAQSTSPQSKHLLASMGAAVRTALAQQAEGMAEPAETAEPAQTSAPQPVAPPRMVNENTLATTPLQTGVVTASNQRLAALANTTPISTGQPRQVIPPQRVIRGMPVAFAPARQVSLNQPISGTPVPAYIPGTGGGVAPAVYDHPNMPGYAWPSYAAYPNYAGLTYPKQYSPTAWPYIGPFYPYPQVPLGWRKVVLEWDDGWWMLDFKSKRHY